MAQYKFIRDYRATGTNFVAEGSFQPNYVLMYTFNEGDIIEGETMESELSSVSNSVFVKTPSAQRVDQTTYDGEGAFEIPIEVLKKEGGSGIFTWKNGVIILVILAIVLGLLKYFKVI